jgi:hypothetical protein
MDKELYHYTIQKFIQDDKGIACCFTCGETNPAVLEMHHIEGRINSGDLILLCKNCHAVISAEQNKLPPKARSSKASHEQKRAYSDISLGALFELSGKKLKEHGFKMSYFG